MRRRWDPSVLVVVSFIPAAAAFIGVQLSEPFPHGWLSPDNPHYWANLLRAATFLVGGIIMGMISYTMIRSIRAEQTVTGGHPRRLLYKHVTYIAVGHGLLILTLLFYIRDRINNDLSPATPLALLALALTVLALSRMLGYQNSRLRSFHSAKQVLGTIEAMPGQPRRLCLRVVGSEEPMALEEWLTTYDTGELVRLTVEKVEEGGA